MNSKLINKHVVLTGAASGLGLSLFRELNDKGCNLHLIDKDFEEDSEENSRIFKYKYNLSDLDNLDDLIKRIKKQTKLIY